MTGRNRILGSTRLAIVFLLVLVVSAIGSSVVDELFADRLFDMDVLPLASVILALLLGVIAVWGLMFWLYPEVGKLVRADAEVVHVSTLKGRKYLITGYSPRLNPATKEQLSLPDADELARCGVEKLCGPGEECRRLLLAWQQNVRTIATLMRGSDLEEVFVINPSIDQFEGFKQTMKAVFPDGPKFTLVCSQDDKTKPFSPKYHLPEYEDFDYVYGSIRQALKMIRQRDSDHADNIARKVVLDITPGQKPYSIAAAIATLNSDMVAIYVTSFGDLREGEGFRCLIYDASIELGVAPI